jgi:two-component system alkaline phosphatase synthesis response regulator PhoP/two-component system response regulator VicR
MNTVRKRALVCDDERHIVRLVQVNLERQGYEVECAYSGLQALELLRASSFDVVILDAEMPGMSGYEVRDWIESNVSTKGMEVIVLDRKKPPVSGSWMG